MCCIDASDRNMAQTAITRLLFSATVGLMFFSTTYIHYKHTGARSGLMFSKFWDGNLRNVYSYACV